MTIPIKVINMLDSATKIHVSIEKINNELYLTLYNLGVIDDKYSGPFTILSKYDILRMSNDEHLHNHFMVNSYRYRTHNVVAYKIVDLNMKQIEMVGTNIYNHHTCDRKPACVNIKNDSGTYKMRIEDYGDWIEINACPFCAEVLNNNEFVCI